MMKPHKSLRLFQRAVFPRPAATEPHHPVPKSPREIFDADQMDGIMIPGITNICPKSSGPHHSPMFSDMG